MQTAVNSTTLNSQKQMIDLRYFMLYLWPNIKK